MAIGPGLTQGRVSRAAAEHKTHKTLCMEPTSPTNPNFSKTLCHLCAQARNQHATHTQRSLRDTPPNPGQPETPAHPPIHPHCHYAGPWYPVAPRVPLAAASNRDPRPGPPRMPAALRDRSGGMPANSSLTMPLSPGGTTKATMGTWPGARLSPTCRCAPVTARATPGPVPAP